MGANPYGKLKVRPKLVNKCAYYVQTEISRLSRKSAFRFSCIFVYPVKKWKQFIRNRVSRFKMVMQFQKYDW